MAETIVLEFDARTDQAVSDINKVASATKEASKETTNYSDTVDKLTGGLATSFKNGVNSVKSLISGFKGLRGAIAATGIGALVIAVTAAVEWFSNFDAAVKITSKVMDGIAGAVNQLGKALDLLLKGDFSGAANAFTQIGDAALTAAENADKLFEVTKALQELQAANIPLNAKLRQDLELQKKILEDTTLTENERLEALKQVTELSSQIQQNAIAENKLKREELELKIANENSDEKRRQLNIELAQVQAELIDQEGQLNIIRKDAEKVEREILNLTREKKLQQLQEELRLEKELAEEKRKNTATRIEREVKAEEERGLAVNNVRLKNVEKQIDIEEKAAENKKRLYEEDRKNREMNVLNGLNTILAINSIFEGKTEAEQKKGFERTKKLNIAATLVETYLAAQKAYSSQVIPFDPTSIVRGALAAAAAVSAGLARVAQIKKTQFNSGGGGSTTPISLNSGSNISSRGTLGGGSGIGFNPSSQTISAIPPINNQPPINVDGAVRAYVIENEITNKQALQKRLNQRAKL